MDGFKNIDASTATFTYMGQTYNVRFETISDPDYKVKVSFLNKTNQVVMVFKKDAEMTKFSFIVFNPICSFQQTINLNSEIRQLKAENVGGVLHTQALFYRKNVDDMNDIVEMWNNGSTLKIKCVRTYDISQGVTQKMNFAAVTDQISNINKTTGMLWYNETLIPESPAIFNDNDLLYQISTNPIPADYPTSASVMSVYNSGVNYNKVSTVTIDPNTLDSTL